MEETEPAVRVRGLRMRYGSKDVLHGVSFTARRGEVLALLGPNGAGKTTTIEILEGFRMRSAGAVRVLGVDPATGGEQWRARLGVVLQSWRDHGKWKVRELLAHLGAHYARFTEPGRRRPMDTDDLLETVGLADRRDQRIASLSGGQRRRLDVAVGITGRPELLFLDEPTAGFDPQARRDFHDLAEAERLADRILILSAGRIVADGSPDALARQVAGTSEVRWACGRERYVHGTEDVVAFVRGLFEQHGDALTDLEVRHASLEDTYLAMVARSETGAPAAPALAGVTR